MAGCYDRSWRVGNKARGTRSQFRLNTEGLLPFKCSYPVHLTDVMDAVPSTHADLSRPEGASPVRGTRTRAVREYEKAIDELKKENFDLKLRLFLLDETVNKNFLRNKGSGSDDNQDNTVQVVVELKLETVTLKTELNKKDQELKEALDQAEKFEDDLRQLQEKFSQQQKQIVQQEELIKELPSQETVRLLTDKNENLVKENEELSNLLSEKDRDLQRASAQEARLLKDENDNLLKENEELNNQLSEKVNGLQEALTQIEELSSKNTALESKVKKSSAAIQGVVYKYYKDVEMIPKEIRPIVQTAVNAAKENNVDELLGAVEHFKTCLSELRSESLNGTSYIVSDRRSHEKSPLKQVSMEELQKSLGIATSFEDRKTELKQSKSVHDIKISSDSRRTNRLPSIVSSESLYESGRLSDSRCGEDSELVKENESLKLDNEEKSRVIDDQNTALNELEERTIQLQSEILDAVSKAKDLEIKLREEKSKRTSSLPKVNSAVQTAVQWHLIQSKISEKLLQNAGLSNNIDDLKEEILTLLLVIEQKEKEISDLEESLQQQMKMVTNEKEDAFTAPDEDYLAERNELHQKLAECSAVNNDLLKHLRNLEKFMENLLQHKNMDSSLESISQTSDFLSRLTTCLDESLKLSTVLSDNLSVCEGSRLFNPNDFTVNKEYSQEYDSSYQPRDQSRVSLTASNIQSRLQGRHNLQTSAQNTIGTGKRRLSFSTLSPKSAADTALIDSENVVVLGTSNNEDLILLLNDRGDPEDVFIRNNHSHIDKSLPKQCWESSSINQWNVENFNFSQQMNNWYASELLNSKKGSAWYNPCPSSDSDIWSEPDRDVSLQRIGIDVQKSPVTQRSPRRSRLRGQRTTDELSSQKHETSSSFTKIHSWSKRRKSSDASRPSYTCKKCMSQAQQTDDVTRDDQIRKENMQKEIDNLLEQCNAQENQMEEMRNNLKIKINLIKNLKEEKDKLSYYVSQLKEELAYLRDEKKLEIEHGEEVNTEVNNLKEYIQKLETKLMHYDSECNELKTALSETKSKLVTLDEKCSEYEKELLKNSEDKQEYIERLKELDGEKEKLMKEVEALVSEKNNLLHDLNSEREGRKSLESERDELNTKLEEISNDVSSLKLTNKELEEERDSLLQDKKIAENNLFASSSLCNELKEDIQRMEKSLEDLESKCSKYEEAHDSLLQEKEIAERNLFASDSLCNDLKEDLNMKERSLEDLESKCTKYEEAHDSLLQEKETIEGNLLVSNSLCNDLKEDLGRKEKSLEDLKSRCTAYEEAHDSLLQQKETAERNLFASNSLCNELKEELEQMEKSLKDFKTKCMTYEEAHASLMQEKETAENNLLASNSLCSELKEEHEKIENSLKDLDSKCAKYENKLSEASKTKQQVIEKLSYFKTGMSANLNNLGRICKQYLNLEGDRLKDNEVNLSFGALSELDKDTQIEKLLEGIVSANKILEQRIDLLSEQLHTIQSALQRSKSAEKEYEYSMNSIRQRLEEKEHEIERLIIQNQQLKSKIDRQYQKSEDNKTLNKEYESKIEVYLQQLQLHQNEISSLKDHSGQLQMHIEELKQLIKDKEKSVEASNLNCATLQHQVDVLQKQAENNRHQLDLRDDEITQLQERIFNLQTQISGHLSEKLSSYSNQMKHSNSKSSSIERPLTSKYFKDSLNLSNISDTSLMKDSSSDRKISEKEKMKAVSEDNICISEHSRPNLNLSSISDTYLKLDVERMGMTDESNDTAVSSASSEKDIDVDHIKREKYIKKIKALQTKLGISEKHIDILKKEKSDLRKELMIQIEKNGRTTNLSSEVETLQKELANLKEKLEAKTSFIKDLKTELQSSYNLLMEKNKEINELSNFKRNVEYEAEASVHDRLQNRYSDPLHQITESSIRELKKHKWELIQDIFKQQKQFYERKNIHLGHFEKFKNYIEKLRALQTSPSLFKSESEPLLNGSTTINNCYIQKCDRTLKNLQIELELDIECFQNIKIFLKRFFIPLILQNCQCAKLGLKAEDDSSAGAASAVIVDEKNTFSEIKSTPDEKVAKPVFPGIAFAQPLSLEALHGPYNFTSNDRLVTTASVVSQKIDSLENALANVNTVLHSVSDLETLPEETTRKAIAKSLLSKFSNELKLVLDKSSDISQLISNLKSLELFPTDVPKSPSKLDMSDRESLLSEETITLSRSGSLSPMSFEEHFPSRLVTAKSRKQSEPKVDYEDKAAEIKMISAEHSHKANAAGGSQESIFQRSHFSSPDLGIESDPNHESSAPEQMEKEEFRDGGSKTPKRHDGTGKSMPWSVDKHQPASMYSHHDTSDKLKDEGSTVTVGDTLHAIGHLKQYQLLKKEVRESLVGIKVVLSRTDDGLHHVAKYTSPRKGIECSTFKAIRDESLNIEICLQEAIKLVDGFWIAPCPSVEELKVLIQQNQELQSKLVSLREAKRRQQSCFEQAMEKLKNAEAQRENIEKNISRKLLKTKRVIREVEVKMLHQRNQALPPLPKYPVDDHTCQKKL